MEENSFFPCTFTEVCRACLCKSDNMKSLIDVQNEAVLGLLLKLSSISNIEILVSAAMPSYLCRICEGKLNFSYEFQQLCKKSNSYILERLTASQKLDFNEEIKEVSLQDASEKVEEEKVFKLKSSEKEVKENDDLSARRLKQFPPHLVADAIRKTKEKLFSHRICGICSFKSNSQRALSIHIARTHRDKKDSWCSICNKEFDNLIPHRKSHLEDDLKCPFCGRTSSCSSHYFDHLAAHSKVKVHKCKICSKSFKTYRYFLIHFQSHVKHKPFKCSVCGKKFARKRSFIVHLRRHSHDHLHFCNRCQSGFDDEEKLLNHDCTESLVLSGKDTELEELSQLSKKKIRRENRDLNTALCPECGKQFRTKSKLNTHMRVHSNERPFKCSYCSLAMKTSSQLNNHQRIHTGVKPHVCKVCGKGFAQSSVLSTHMKIHIGRPEQCTICDKKFCRPSELKLHLRYHTGEKPFSCKICNNSFVQRSHLMGHLRTHSDERPYQCDLCEKAFKYMSSLTYHKKMHSGEKPFKCDYCQFAARKNYILQQHLKQHEKEFASQPIGLVEPPSFEPFAC